LKDHKALSHYEVGATKQMTSKQYYISELAVSFSNDDPEEGEKVSVGVVEDMRKL